MKNHATLSIVLLLTLGSAPLRSQTPLHVFDGSGGNSTGYSVDVDGDANGDGRSDVIVSSTANRVRVYSGMNGGLLYDFAGRAAAWAGDVNADGFDDIVLRRMPGTPPLVEVYSGFNGALIHQIAGVTGSSYGWSVDGAGDFNDDGYDDFIIGAPGANQATGSYPNGRFEVRSGQNGALLLGVDGTSQQVLGGSVSGAGDVNADGFDDVLVGTGDGALASSVPGRARVYSGSSGAILHQIVDSSPVANHHYRVKGAGDLDQDGRDDFLVGIPQFNASAGRVQAHSGLTGGILFTLNGAAAGEGMGFALSGAGDIDGDTVPDIVVGSYMGLAGRVRVCSGAGGALLREITDLGSDQGYSVAGGGDVDGDGIPEVATGNPLIVSTGRARVYAGVTCRDDLHPGTGDGVSLVPALDGSPDVFSVLLARPGMAVVVHAGVPAGLGSAPLFVFGQIFPTAAGMPFLAGFPAIHLNPALFPPLVTLFDSTVTVFGPTAIPAAGIDVFLGVVPNGFAGLSLALQAFSIGGPASANGTFSASDAKELRLL